MTGNITVYRESITSEHRDKPNFMAMVSSTFQPFADLIAVYNSADLLYDLPTAVGAQLDLIGQWVGVSRTLEYQLPVGTYFAFDVSGLGFDQGIWKLTTDPSTGLIVLPDDHYRFLLSARIINNHWAGDIPSLYTLSKAIFEPLGYSLLVLDNGDLTMDLGMAGVGASDVTTQTLLVNDYFNLRPIGVKVRNTYVPSTPGPIFALGIMSPALQGLGTGAWAKLL